MFLRILPLLALGLAGSAVPAQAQTLLARFCNDRIRVYHILPDPGWRGDQTSATSYAARFSNTTALSIKMIVTFTGPAGTTSQAQAREIMLRAGAAHVPLVIWPIAMEPVDPASIARGVQVTCR